MMIPASSYTLKAASLGRCFIGLFPSLGLQISRRWNVLLQTRHLYYFHVLGIIYSNKQVCKGGHTPDFSVRLVFYLPSMSYNILYEFRDLHVKGVHWASSQYSTMFHVLDLRTL